MRQFRAFSSGFIAAVLAVGLLASCAPKRTPTPEPEPAPKPEPEPVLKPVPKPDLSVPRQFLEAGDFQGAIDSYQTLYEGFPADRSLREEYLKALEQIKLQADNLQQRKEFRAAVRVYSLLLDNYPRFQNLEPDLSFRPDSLRRQIRSSQAAAIELEAARTFAAEHFEKALGVYLNAAQAELRMPELEPGFRKTAEAVMRRAEESEAKGDFIAAGKASAALLHHLDTLGKLKPPPPLSREDLAARLGRCRSELTRRGLEEYRRGNLKEAIAFWQGLLEFDPENAEIRKAVERASEQLKKLKKEAPSC